MNRQVDDRGGTPTRGQAKVAVAWPPVGNMAWQRMPLKSTRVPRGHGTLRLALSSEPDLITAHTGYSIDVAQHWETDETLAGEEAAGR